MTTPQTLAPIPRLAPGTYTAYRVLQHVAKLIEEEPRRLRMADWVTAIADTEKCERYMDDVPACGTAACAAGWINIATGQDKGLLSPYLDSSRAFAVLGLPYNGYAPDAKRNEVRGALDRLFMETNWTAAQVVPELRRIIATYRGVLASRKVVVK